MYVPSPYSGPIDAPTLQSYLERELDAIMRELAETTVVELRPVYAEPSKPRTGMIVYADGTEWNPGSGAGLYVYKGSWTFIA